MNASNDEKKFVSAEIPHGSSDEEEEAEPRRTAGNGTKDSKRRSRGKRLRNRRQVWRGRFSEELLREREMRCSKTGAGRPSTAVRHKAIKAHKRERHSLNTLK
ncbi:hypothetical protein NPIL_47091 [Nephila pilipes]|uniref:Uncharacterized protein n=1 Tax=Nephila pilipes TaxID=299642 RepID=A0A8X6PZ28_NEPPI|nr:hypothetical protein NPIL_47091 [Nephila pilipes]